MIDTTGAFELQDRMNIPPLEVFLRLLPRIVEYVGFFRKISVFLDFPSGCLGDNYDVGLACGLLALVRLIHFQIIVMKEDAAPIVVILG
jgi:hypothetical protein